MPKLEPFKKLRGFRQVGQGSFMACCPAHDDKTPSLSITEISDGVLCHCHAGCAYKDVISELGLADHRSSTKPNESYAQQIWHDSYPITGTLVERYLINRGLSNVTSAALRYHKKLKHQSKSEWPAMISLITHALTGEPMGVHRTFLALDGSSKAPVEKPKMMLGRSSGGVIQLGKAGNSILVGEGIETCLSGMLATGTPAWVAMSAGGLRTLDLPSEITRVTVLADGDDAGESAAVYAAERWASEGRQVNIARAPKNADFNDILINQTYENAESGLEAVRAIINAGEPVAPKKPSCFGDFAIRESYEEMVDRLGAETQLLGPLATNGQMTILYAPTNKGKTLLTLYLVQELLSSQFIGRERYFQVVYVNADDNSRGIAEKQNILQPMGVQQLAPGHNGFEPNLLWMLMQNAVAEGMASQYVVILDTLKKWIDLFDSKGISSATKSLKKFTAAGGTVFALAHTNKHTDEEGKLVYKGTTDVLDDWDCAWIGQPSDTSTHDILTLSNLKMRSDQPSTVSYQWLKNKDYETKFRSVERVAENEVERIEQKAAIKAAQEEHCVIIDAIESAISSGITGKTKIIERVSQDSGEGTAYIRSVIDKFTGPPNSESALWFFSKGERNLHSYVLNKGDGL